MKTTSTYYSKLLIRAFLLVLLLVVGRAYEGYAQTVNLEGFDYTYGFELPNVGGEDPEFRFSRNTTGNTANSLPTKVQEQPRTDKWAVRIVAEPNRGYNGLMVSRKKFKFEAGLPVEISVWAKVTAGTGTIKFYRSPTDNNFTTLVRPTNRTTRREAWTFSGTTYQKITTRFTPSITSEDFVGIQMEGSGNTMFLDDVLIMQLCKKSYPVTVSNSGLYCTEGESTNPGLTIGIPGSEAGITYRLSVDKGDGAGYKTVEDKPSLGEGLPLTFTGLKVEGTYKINALSVAPDSPESDPVSGCNVEMQNTVTITVISENRPIHVIITTFNNDKKINDWTDRICKGDNITYYANVFLGGYIENNDPNNPRNRPTIAGNYINVTEYFTFEWVKDDGGNVASNNTGPIAGGTAQLSSETLITAFATLKQGALICAAPNNGTNRYKGNDIYLDNSEYFTLALNSSANVHGLDNTLCMDDDYSVTFTATATYTGPAEIATDPANYIYSWFRIRDGQTTSLGSFVEVNTLSINAQDINNQDQYYYTFQSTSTSCGSPQSPVVIMNKWTNPEFVTPNPVSSPEVCAGLNITLSETVKSGSGPSTFVWYRKKGGVTQTIDQLIAEGAPNKYGVSPEGASTLLTTSLTINAATADDAAEYYVVVTGTCTPTTATSASRTLTINSPPVATLPDFKDVCISSAEFTLDQGSGDLPGEGVYQINSTTAPATTTFNPATVGLGTHTIYYTFTSDKGCSSVTVSKTITVTNTTIWTGEKDDNWFDPDNWTSCVPDFDIDVNVPVTINMSGDAFTPGVNAKVVPVIPVNSSEVAKVRTLTVHSSVTVSAESTIELKGNFVIEGDGGFDANPESTTIFSGTSAQKIAGGDYDLLVITGGDPVTPKVLQGYTYIRRELVLQSKLESGNFDVEVDGIISGYSKDGFIIQNGTGTLIYNKVLENETEPDKSRKGVFPIGTSLEKYNPATIINEGDEATFVVQVKDGFDDPPTNNNEPLLSGIYKTWYVKPLNGAKVKVTLTLEWQEADEVDFDKTMAFLSHFEVEEGSWRRHGPFHDLTETPRALTQGDITTFSPFAVGSGLDNLPLPVTLSFFQAEKSGSDVVLTWETASEQNNKGFGVEVSLDGEGFRGLAFVNSKSANSQSQQRYSFRDSESGKHGTRYYRLRQTDLDGTVSYSATRAVAFEGLQVGMATYPNPFSDDMTLEVLAEQEDQLHLTVTDVLGRVVLSREVALLKGSNKVDLSLGNHYPKGLYLISARFNGTVQQAKVMKQR
jgi:hypothetical protein